MKDNGEMIIEKGQGMKDIRQGIGIEETLRMGKRKGKEFTSGQMESIMMENGSMG